MVISMNLKNKVIVNFGDSIFGNKRPPNDISTALADITGATVYNCGFGGCRMSCHLENWDAFSMYRIATAITERDFSYQDSIDVDSVEGMPEYFKEARELLKKIDFNKVDIITIAYGTNDYTSGRILTNHDDKKDVKSFTGALRFSIEKITECYPHIKIFLCTPTYRFWMDENGEFIEDSDTKICGASTLIDFVRATQNVANEYHLKCINNYFELGINKFNRKYYFPNNDGTHHNINGAKLIAEHMASELF